MTWTISFWCDVVYKARRWSSQAAIKIGTRRRSKSCFIEQNSTVDKINFGLHKIITIIKISSSMVLEEDILLGRRRYDWLLPNVFNPRIFSSFFDRYRASVFDKLNTSHNLAVSLIVAILSILFIYFVFSIIFIW